MKQFEMQREYNDPSMRILDLAKAVAPGLKTEVIGENGTPVSRGFEYNSGTNDHFLTVEELRAMM